MKKYEFTGETKQVGFFGNITLKRIRATMEFGIIKIGDLGGWIEKEENLSHKGNAWVYDNAEVYDNAKVYGNAKVYDNAEVWGDAKVYDNAKVYGNAKVCGDAKVFSISHVLVIGPIGSRNDFTTFFRDKDSEITVKCGCFLGKIDKFLGKVCETHGDSKYAIVYRTAAEIAKQQIDLSEENNYEIK